MSGELERLLRASMEADTPDWLDRLVAERAIAAVERESAAQAAGSPGRDVARAALATLQRGRELVAAAVSELLPGKRGAEASPGRVLDDPNGA